MVELGEVDTSPNLKLSLSRHVPLSPRGSSNSSSNNNNNNPFVEPQANSSRGNVNAPVRPNASKGVKVPVYKWALKFSGVFEKDRMTPTEFVLRAMDYMTSRNISEEELYLSAIDLFEGTAYQWFRLLGNLGDNYPRNWTELSARLLSDFEKPDYLEDLEDHIRNRKQRSDENIV